MVSAESVVVTVFDTIKNTKSPSHLHLGRVLSSIATGGTQKEVVEYIRKLPEEQYKVAKRELPVICFNGIFNSRSIGGLQEANGLMVLDFDEIDDIPALREKLYSLSYVYSVFLSPSGRGLKALIRIPIVSSDEQFKRYFQSIQEELPVDPSGKDISRACFFSYDPNIYINENATQFTKLYRVPKTNIEERRERSAKRRSDRITSIAIDMIRNSDKGELHNARLKAGRLIGGYIASGILEENRVVDILLNEIRYKTTDFEAAKKDLLDGIGYGKSSPLYEAKKIEKQSEFVKREDGKYDFIADDEEMDAYEKALINGTLEMGLETGIHNVDLFWRLKLNHIVWWVGADNIGKTTVVWYFSVLAAMFHDWKFLIYSAENTNGQTRKKLKEMYIGKKLTQMNTMELDLADKFIKDHFVILSNKELYDMENILLRCELVFDSMFQYECVIIEPFNAIDGDQTHATTTKYMNMLRAFKENYASVWAADHINSSFLRAKDEDGNTDMPYKGANDGGAMKMNKTDDSIMLHRKPNSEIDWNVTLMRVDKIKDTETGGKPSPIKDPIRLVMNSNQCGFTCGGVDVVANYWAKYKSATQEEVQFKNVWDDF